MTNPNRCPKCGANLALVGKRHRCVPAASSTSSPTANRGSKSGRGVPIPKASAAAGAKKKKKSRRASSVAGKAAGGKASATSRSAGGRIKRHVGRPRKDQAHKTLAAIKPWDQEGISRAKWFRNQKKR